MQPNRPQTSVRQATEALAKRVGSAQSQSDSRPSGVAYTSKPDVDGEDAARRSARTKRRWIAAIAAAVVLGAGAILMGVHDDGPPRGANKALSQSLAQQENIFLVSDTDLDRDATVQAKAALNRGEIPPSLATVPEGTRQQIASGEASLYSVRLLDFQDEDGDAVKILLNDIPFGELVLSNSGAKLTIPLKKGATTKITCLASQDGGGGGVTFRAISSVGEMRTRVMAVGESESWTVSLK